MATAIGLATGMGYLALAVFFTLVLSAVLLTLEHLSFVKPKQHSGHILLTVAKDFDYDQFFEHSFGKSCKKAQLLSLKYKKKKEALVLEYLLETDKSLSDAKIVQTILAAGTLDVVLNKEIPKKKRL